MTSTKLSNNRFKEHLKWNFINQKIMWVFAAVPFLLYAVIMLTQTVSYYTHVDVMPPDMIEFQPLNISSLFAMASVVSTLLSIVLSFILVAMFNDYLFSKRKLDLLHAVPITRRAMLMSNYVSIVISALIPQALSLIFIPIMKSVAKDGKNLFSFNGLLAAQTILICALVVVTCISIFIFSAVSAGTTPMFVMFSVGIIGLFFTGLEMLINYVPSVIAGMPYSNAVYYISPVNVMNSVLNTFSTIESSSVAVSAAALLVMIAVFLILAVKVYDKRNSEDSEVTNSSSIPVILTMFGIDSIIIYMSRFSKKAFIIPVIILVMLAASILCQLILTKSKNIKPALIQFGVMGMVFVAIYTIGATGAFGYENKVPQISEIQSVKFQLKDNAVHDSTVAVKYAIGSFIYGYNNNDDNPIVPELTEKETIEKVIDFEKKAVELFNDKSYNNSTKRMYTIEYKLKNGKVIEKEFPVGFYYNGKGQNFNQIADQANAIFCSGEYIAKSKFQYNSDDVIKVVYNHGEYTFDIDLLENLIQAIKKDWTENEFAKSSFGTHTAINVANIDIIVLRDGCSLTDYEKKVLEKGEEYLYDSNRMYTDQILINSNMINTIKLLENAGYLYEMYDSQKNVNSFDKGYVVPAELKDGKNYPYIININGVKFDGYIFWNFSYTDKFDMQKSYGFEEITDKAVIEKIAFVIDNSKSYAEQLLEKEKGYFVYFIDQENDRKSTIYFVSEEDMISCK